MIIQVTENMFRSAFIGVRPDNFSYAGLGVLFEHLESYKEETEVTVELDVIAICCEYTESTIQDALDDYGLETLEELEENTCVLRIDINNSLDDRIIYQNY